MVEHLGPIVLFVLDWVKGEVDLGEQIKLLNVLQLEHFHDVVEGEVEEAERGDVLEAGEVPDMVLG